MYAKWEANRYQITFNYEHNSSNPYGNLGYDKKQKQQQSLQKMELIQKQPHMMQKLEVCQIQHLQEQHLLSG